MQYIITSSDPIWTDFRDLVEAVDTSNIASSEYYEMVGKGELDHFIVFRLFLIYVSMIKGEYECEYGYVYQLSYVY